MGAVTTRRVFRTEAYLYADGLVGQRSLSLERYAEIAASWCGSYTIPKDPGTALVWFCDISSVMFADADGRPVKEDGAPLAGGFVTVVSGSLAAHGVQVWREVTVHDQDSVADVVHGFSAGLEQSCRVLATRIEGGE